MHALPLLANGKKRCRIISRMENSVSPHPKEFPWLLSNIDAFVVPEVFFHCYCLSKNLSMTENEGNARKVSCHMLEVFFKKCAWENAFWAAAASSQIYLHGHNSVARLLLLLGSFAAKKALLYPPASQLMHHPTTYFFLLLLCLLSLLLLLLLLRPELSFFSFC